MKLKLLSGVVLLSALALSACGDQSNGKIILRMAQASASDGAIGISMDEFARQVNEKTDEVTTWTQTRAPDGSLNLP